MLWPTSSVRSSKLQTTCLFLGSRFTAPTGEEVVVAVVDDSSLKLKVTIKADFVATVQVYGLLAPDETDNIEKQSLKSFLLS